MNEDIGSRLINKDLMGHKHVDENHHVHFTEEQIREHDSCIHIKSEGDQLVGAHLGFLSLNHKYEIAFDLPNQLAGDICADLLSGNVRVVDIKPKQDGSGHTIRLHFFARKEKLMQEKVRLQSAHHPSSFLDLALHARVLGKFKGTPALKEGIHCIGVDEEVDLSD